MATKLHLLTFAEQRHQRQQRRTNYRLLFLCGAIGAMAFCAGMLVGCGAGVEAAADDQVRVPAPCTVEVAPGQFKPGDCPKAG